MTKVFFSELFEPIFAKIATHDYIYIDANMTKYSTRRVDNTYLTFSENLALKWPGYVLGKSGHILNKTDKLVDLGSLISLLRSSDINRYETEKNLFFGP